MPDTAGVQDASLSAFVTLSVPGLALGRNGVPKVVPVEIDLEGVSRRLGSAQARELARLLDRAASECDQANAELLPPLHDFVARYEAREACG